MSRNQRIKIASKEDSLIEQLENNNLFGSLATDNLYYSKDSK